MAPRTPIELPNFRSLFKSRSEDWFGNIRPCPKQATEKIRFDRLRLSGSAGPRSLPARIQIVWPFFNLSLHVPKIVAEQHQ